VVVHEIGHILGISGGFVVGGEPGEYNIYPHHVGGVQNVLVLDNGSHLGGNATVPGFLMCDGCATPGGRYYPSATDVLAIAEDQGLTSVHLQRVGGISSGFWSDASKWIGAEVPNLTQDVYIRHGGATTLNADEQARSLLVASGSSVVVQNHRLTVDDALAFPGAALSVGAGGTIVADSLSGDAGALATAAGSLVRFNQFATGASSLAAFNGSVAIGYNKLASLPTEPLLPFDPTAPSWTIAEQLAIGDANTISTLVIDGNADFTSGSGRIGTSSSGGTGHVDITGAGSTWTIAGALDARQGSVDVLNKGVLTTGSATLGDAAGQMRVTVNDATWNVNGSVNAGPPTLTGLGRGNITVQNAGQMTVAGNLNVHGTSSLLSEVTVESGGRLEVNGNVIVGPYSRVTYGNDTAVANETFTNLGNAADYAVGGVTQFTANATAGNGTFINNGATGLFGYGGQTRFDGASTAGFAAITNAGPTGVYNFSGKTIFNDAASADNAIITNLPSNYGATTTEFYGNSTAGSATIINQSGAYPSVAGITTFRDASSAGSGSFINEHGGQFIFEDSSTAGQGTFTNGAFGGLVIFKKNSSAGEANIAVRASGDSRLIFYDDSTAGAAHIDVGPLTLGPTNESSLAQFFGNSTAANSTITVRGDGGSVSFAGSTAGYASIVALGSTRPGSIPGTAPGQVLFSSFSTAANATITAQPSTVAGAPGGLIQFHNAGHAGSATLIANGGATPANGGLIRFASAGTGGSARLVVNAGAQADFSLNAFHGGTAVGSIEGAGKFSIGGSMLTVGNLNTSTTVSGTISDSGGYHAGTGGMLTKVGAGTLTLSGANSYTGLTTVDEGTLVNNGSIAGSAVVKDGGILKGIGSIGPVAVEGGGQFSPGTSPGTITVGGLNLMSGSTLNYELGAATRDRIVVTGNGHVSLAGILNLSLLDGFSPAPGQTYSLFEGAVGSITGTFSTVIAPTSNGHTLNVLYGVNQVILQVGDANFLAADFTEDGLVDGKRSGQVANQFWHRRHAHAGRCQRRSGRQRRRLSHLAAAIGQRAKHRDFGVGSRAVRPDDGSARWWRVARPHSTTLASRDALDLFEARPRARRQVTAQSTIAIAPVLISRFPPVQILPE
jgi:autotransporter-associated beta strand protein